MEQDANPYQELRSDFEFQKQVYRHIGSYAKASWIDSVLEVAITILMLSLCLQFESVLWAPALALVYVRSFIIFHDMGHRAFFPTARANWVGGLLFGALTFTPLSYWVEGHTYHHANSNKLNRPQHAQTASWETSMYLSSSFTQRLIYKLSYGCYTLFTIVPPIYFFVLHRFVSKWYESGVQLAYLVFLWMYLDQSQYVYVCVSLWLAAILGFVLFHAQHTFDGVYRAFDARDLSVAGLNGSDGTETDIDSDVSITKAWRYFMNGMYGSSYLQVPWYLQIFTCNIQYHHIHHLNPNVPFYRLRECHEAGACLFEQVPRTTLTSVLYSLRYSLYNAQTRSFENVYKY